MPRVMQTECSKMRLRECRETKKCKDRMDTSSIHLSKKRMDEVMDDGHLIASTGLTCGEYKLDAFMCHEFLSSYCLCIVKQPYSV